MRRIRAKLEIEKMWMRKMGQGFKRVSPNASFDGVRRNTCFEASDQPLSTSSKVASGEAGFSDAIKNWCWQILFVPMIKMAQEVPTSPNDFCASRETSSGKANFLLNWEKKMCKIENLSISICNRYFHYSIYHGLLEIHTHFSYILVDKD